MIPSAEHIVSRFLTQAALVMVTLAREHGLKPLECMALTMVGEHEPMPMKKLRVAFRLSSGTLTFTVDSLEKRGLVRRRRGDSDRRQISLCLSAKGRKLYDRMLETESNLVMPAFEGFSDAELATIVRMADRMTERAR